MHVGVFVLNVPVYQELLDLLKLSAASELVSERLITARLQSIEAALFSSESLPLLQAWDQEMQLLVASNLPGDQSSEPSRRPFTFCLKTLAFPVHRSLANSLRRASFLPRAGIGSWRLWICPILPSEDHGRRVH